MILCSFLSPYLTLYNSSQTLYNFLDPFRLLSSTVLFLILEQPLNQPLNNYLSTILLFYSFFPLKKKKSYIPWKPFIQNSYPLLLLLLELPRWLSDKKSACQWRRCGSSPWVGTIPGEGNGNPLQYSYLENPMDRGAWRVTVHGLQKSQTQLSD